MIPKISFQESWDSQKLNGMSGLISAVVTLDVTAYPSLELIYSPESKIYSMIKTSISIFTIDGLFCGRVARCQESMSNDGQIQNTVSAVGLEDFLHDSVQPFGEFHNMTPKDFLQTLINSHNAQVESYKRMSLGTVNVTNSTDNVYRFTDDAEDTYNTIQDKLISKLGGEINVENTDSGLVLNYIVQRGTQGKQTIALSKNLLALTELKDSSEIATVLKPLGGVIDQGTNAVSNPRLTIESVNHGSPFLKDDLLISLFGIHTVANTWDDVTTPDALLTKGKQYLASQENIKTSVQVSAVDLSLIGIDTDTIALGNYYKVVNSIMGFSQNIRVISESIDVLRPESSTFTFGNAVQGIEQYRASLQKEIDASNKTAEQFKVTRDRVNKLMLDAETVSKSIDTLRQITNDLESRIDNVNSYTGGDITYSGKTISQANLNSLRYFSKVNNIVPSFVVAQMFVESKWGDSDVGRTDNNWSGISEPFAVPDDLNVKMRTGSPRPSNEGGNYVHFETLSDYFKAYAFVLSSRNGIYKVAGASTIDDFCKGLFKAGGATYDYAEAGYDAYSKLLVPTYNSIVSANQDKIKQLDR